MSTDFGKIPLYFVPNEGQVDGPAAFYVQGKDKTIYFAPGGLTFALSGPPARPPAGRWVVKLDFVGADPEAAPASLEESGAVVSYFKGKPEEWKTGLRASSKIIYRELWPGIDLILYGTIDQMKYEFIVSPGADPSMIRLAYRGAESVTLTGEGRLAIATPAGNFEDDVPMAWQDMEGVRADVPVAYVLEAEKAGPEGPTYVCGFAVGEYDKSLPLVLDPAVLVYCGYIGGRGWEEGKKIAVDGSGNAYVTGYTGCSESTFPVTVGPDLTYNGQPSDVFVAKVKADGTGLVYCGFIGGNGIDEGYGIAADGSGCAYITGQTSSTNFPVTPGSDLLPTGGKDAIIAKVNADGTDLVYVGCIAGWDIEEAYGIAVDGSGCAYVVGWTWSSDLPVKVGPDLTANGSQDAFIAKVDASGKAIVYCGYIGGWANEEGYGIAVDASGSAYVTGRAASPDFPFKNGPGLTPGGWYDVFVAKVNTAGTALDYGGYIAGRWDDVGYGIAVDASGNAYVTGYTDVTGVPHSDDAVFPVRVGPDLTWNGGYSDAFVAKVSADGTALVYCGYIGGDANERGNAIAVDDWGNAYIAGESDSPEATFPVRVGPDLTWNGWTDAFVAKVNAVGTALVYCGYVGGEDNDRGRGIAVDGSGNAYMTGDTFSPETTFPVTVGPDLTFNCPAFDDDGFVAKISAYDIQGPTLASVSPSSATVGDQALTMSLSGGDFEDGSVVMWDGSDRPTVFMNDGELSAEIGAADLETGKIIAVTVRNPNGGVSNAAEFTVNNPLPLLTSLSPPQATVGGSWFTLTVHGSKFVPGSFARWDGQARDTTYVSGTELRAAIASEDIDTAGQFEVTVVNPAPGGGVSGPVGFPIAAFTMGASPASVTVTAGQSANYTVQVTPQYGAFDAAVSFSGMGLPRGCTALFSPASVTPGANPASSTLLLKTSARQTEATAGMFAASAMIPPALGFLTFISAFVIRARSRRPALARLPARWLTAAALVFAIGLIASCSAGGDNNPPPNTGTPAGTYQITVQGKSGSLEISTAVTLIVR